MGTLTDTFAQQHTHMWKSVSNTRNIVSKQNILNVFETFFVPYTSLIYYICKITIFIAIVFRDSTLL